MVPIVAAAAELVVLHPNVFDFLLPVLLPTAHTLPTSPLQALTPREIEVLGILAEGLGNKAIARHLGISATLLSVLLSRLVFFRSLSWQYPRSFWIGTLTDLYLVYDLFTDFYLFVPEYYY